MTTIGQRVREARQRAALSQADLAERAGLQEVTISRIENERYGPPRPSTIRKLADALRVTPAWLLYGEGVEAEGKEAA